MKNKWISRTTIITSFLIGGMIIYGLIQNVGSNNQDKVFQNGLYNVSGQNFKTVGIENGNATFTQTDNKKVVFLMVEGEEKKVRYITFQNKKTGNTNLYKIVDKVNDTEFYVIKKGKVSDKISFKINK